MAQEETVTFLMKLRVGKNPHAMSGSGWPPRFTHSPDKGTEVQPEESRWAAGAGEGRLQRSKKGAGTLAAVSSGPGRLTGASPAS